METCIDLSKPIFGIIEIITQDIFQDDINYFNQYDLKCSYFVDGKYLVDHIPVELRNQIESFIKEYLADMKEYIIYHYEYGTAFELIEDLEISNTDLEKLNYYISDQGLVIQHIQI